MEFLSSPSSSSLNGHSTPSNCLPPPIQNQQNHPYDSVAVSSLPTTNGYSHRPFNVHNEEIIHHLYHAGLSDWREYHYFIQRIPQIDFTPYDNVHQNSYRLHAIILSRSPFLAHLMSTSPPASGQRVIYVQLDNEPEVTQEVCIHSTSIVALGYLYSSVSLNLIRPENSRGVLAAGCLLGGMDDLCAYAYESCRQSINLETIHEWLEFVDNIPGSDGSFSPEQQTLTPVFGQYARKLRDDVFHFLVDTLPNALEVNSPAISESGSSQGQIFSLVPFDMFKAAVESPAFQIGSDQSRFKFAKDAIELRKKGIARGRGAEETVVLAFGGSDMGESAVHVTRKIRKRPLWKVHS
ncbi:hypothetical protein F5141DRAFT_1131287 [Pisolithus sp. B1]|nr:hypothetical protein F5141DRAFT_1131287 [Pisolithus sp. B1]